MDKKTKIIRLPRRKSKGLAMIEVPTSIAGYVRCIAARRRARGQADCLIADVFNTPEIREAIYNVFVREVTSPDAA